MRYLLLLSLFALGALAADDHEGHDHGHDHDDHDHPWEWAGVFELKATDKYTWTAEKGESGEYPDATMTMLILPTDDADAHGIEHVEDNAKTLFQAATAPPEKISGEVLPIGSVVKLKFDQDTWVSKFSIRPTTNSPYAFFCQHFPIEFENNVHYLKDQKGNDVEPTAEEPVKAAPATDIATNDGEIGTVLIGSLLTALPSLLFIALVVPLMEQWKKMGFEAIPTVPFSFSSGALFGVTVFLLLGEGLHLASAGKSEVDGVWTWGTAIMGGWFFCVMIAMSADLLFPQDKAETKVQESEAPVQCLNLAIAGPVIFGDFWHNIVDGMVIGFSAKFCSSSMTWTIIGVTIAHEAPQEIADFIILITRGGMKWYWAAVSNFAAGLSAVLGAVISYSADLSYNLQGVCLAFGGGVYLYIAMTECGNHMVSKGTTRDYLMRLAAFAVGAAGIGLVLLGHEHCIKPVAEGEVDPHAGHNH